MLTFVPDEEIGGLDGMNVLLASQFFAKYCSRVAVALDEGIAASVTVIVVYN